MASNDAARHGLYAQLEHVLGHEHADTLMAHLPHDRGDEVASKSDLARLEKGMDEGFAAMRADMQRMGERIDARISVMEERFDRRSAQMEERFDRRFLQMDSRIDRMQRLYVATTVGSMTALTAIFSFVVVIIG